MNLGFHFAPIWACLALGAAQAAPPAPMQKSFSDANALYQQSRYDAAIASYRNLLKSAPHNATLHYNLGNAYFRFAQPGSLGLAIACYERAFALRPRDPDIRHNLDFALQRAGETLVPPGMPAAFFVLFNFLSAMELSGLFWLGFWCSSLLGSLYLWRQNLRGGLRPWLNCALAVWALAGLWRGARALNAVSSPGVILSQAAEARSGPSESFPVSFKAPEGRLVTILDIKSNWLEIGLLKEGLKGWVPAEAVEKI